MADGTATGLVTGKELQEEMKMIHKDLEQKRCVLLPVQVGKAGPCELRRGITLHGMGGASSLHLALIRCVM